MLKWTETQTRMFRLENDSLFSKFGKGSTLGEWFEDIETRNLFQNFKLKNVQLDSEWPSMNKVIGSQPPKSQTVMVQMVEN